jgi:tetratricopeptide (TPR) repeat protein
MYTFNTFFAALILYLIVSELCPKTEGSGTNANNRLYLTAFLFGLGAGNRMDLILLFPGFLYLAWIKAGKKPLLSYAGYFSVLALFFLLGFSVYLYLPLRSARNPVFDWNHPVGIDKLLATLTRKSHGGTLDLLSTQYAKGANFPAGIVFYIKRLSSGFAWCGIPLGLFGLWAALRRNIYFGVTTLLCFLFSCVWFIYEANMPPNPHALAVLEAHFLMPNLVFMLWVGAGTLEITRYLRSRTAPQALFALALCAVIAYSFAARFNDDNKRDNYFAYDYARNASCSLPTGSIAVLKEDVQLFSMWYYENVAGKRKDITVIAQGLSGSKWYQDMLARNNPGVYVGPLRDRKEWSDFLELNAAGRVFLSNDTELQKPDGYRDEPLGLITRVEKANNPAGGTLGGKALMDDMYSYRGDYDYDAYYEFFTPDLIEEYAAAHQKLGYFFMNSRDYENAKKEYYSAVYFKGNFPTAMYQLGYVYLVQGKYDEARGIYLKAKKLYEYNLDLASQYNSMPTTVDGIKNELAEVCLHLGVVSEHLNDPRAALDYYTQAIENNGRLAGAYFNRAVIYWRVGDWNSVVRELTAAVEIDPNYAEARQYLAVAMGKLKSGK